MSVGLCLALNQRLASFSSIDAGRAPEELLPRTQRPAVHTVSPAASAGQIQFRGVCPPETPEREIATSSILGHRRTLLLLES